MSKCKNLSIKLSKKLYCKKKKKEIKIRECSNCKFKEYSQQMHNHCAKDNKKFQKCTTNQKYCAKMKNKSNKLSKLERTRDSLICSNDRCYLCNSKHNLTWHEIYSGKNRQNSMKYKLCLRLCLKCHKEKQEDLEFNNYWKRKGQQLFIKNYPNLDFQKLFHRNYLD